MDSYINFNNHACSCIILCRFRNATWSSSSSFWIAAGQTVGISGWCSCHPCLMQGRHVGPRCLSLCEMGSKKPRQNSQPLRILSKFLIQSELHDFISRSTPIHQLVHHLLFDAPSWQSLDSHYLSGIRTHLFFFAKLVNFQCKLFFSDRICRNYPAKIPHETNYQDSSNVKNPPQYPTSALSPLTSQ